MLRLFVTAIVLLTVGATAPADERTPQVEAQYGGTAQPQGSGSAMSTVIGTGGDRFEGLLMTILAAAGIGLQLRRRYRASERAWQRIAVADSLAPEIGSPRRQQEPTPAMAAPAMTWQQTPT